MPVLGSRFQTGGLPNSTSFISSTSNWPASVRCPARQYASTSKLRGRGSIQGPAERPTPVRPRNRRPPCGSSLDCRNRHVRKMISAGLIADNRNSFHKRFTRQFHHQQIVTVSHREANKNNRCFSFVNLLVDSQSAAASMSENIDSAERFGQVSASVPIPPRPIGAQQAWTRSKRQQPWF